MKENRIKVQSVSYTSGEKKLQTFANLNIRTGKGLKHGSKSTKKKKKKWQQTGTYSFNIQKAQQNRSPCHSINNVQHLPCIEHCRKWHAVSFLYFQTRVISNPIFNSV